MIAHAGGAIDNQTYTNAKEAVARSIEKGYKFIELDLVLSTDGFIVGSHDPIDKTLAEFMETKIKGVYSPLSYKEINEFMENNRGVVLVTDKLNDFDKLKEQLFWPDRMIVEVFSLESYNKAIEMGYKYPAFCIWNYADPQWLLENNIKMITATISFLKDYPHIAKQLHDVGVTILTFSENSQEEFNKRLGVYTSMFYTDFGLE